MELNKKFVFFFLICTFLPLAAQAEDAVKVSPTACSALLEEKRAAATEKIRDFERFLNQAYVDYFKLWETVYNPLWQARVKKDDRFSANLRAEGEVLYNRYYDRAANQQKYALEEEASAVKSLEQFKVMVEAFPACCSVIFYKECLSFRRDEILSEIADLEKLLKRTRQEWKVRSADIRKTVFESPSDHDDFGGRFAGTFENWTVKIWPAFLSKVRVLTEKLEVDFPAEKCCAYCTPDKLGVSQDPVLVKLRPDPQAEKGVSGNLVNNSDVRKAFKELDRREGNRES